MNSWDENNKVAEILGPPLEPRVIWLYLYDVSGENYDDGSYS